MGTVQMVLEARDVLRITEDDGVEIGLVDSKSEF